MGWVLSHLCENESCVHALVYQEKEPDWVKSEYCGSFTLSPVHFLLSLYKSLEITVNAPVRICGRGSDMLMILIRCF